MYNLDNIISTIVEFYVEFKASEMDNQSTDAIQKKEGFYLKEPDVFSASQNEVLRATNNLVLLT